MTGSRGSVARFRYAADVAASWCALVFVDLRLKALPHRLNNALLQPDPPRSEGAPQFDALNPEAIMNCARPVQAAARHPFLFNMSCLRQALVIRSRLYSRGIAASLVYGARKAESGFEVHAWVEAGGLRINGIEGGGFSRFGTSGGGDQRG
mgnify:CR=1 FL=1